MTEPDSTPKDMSQPQENAAQPEPTPQPPAESSPTPEASQLDEQQAAEGADQGEQGGQVRPRIRIGSQRFSEDLQRPKPQAEAPAAPQESKPQPAAAASETQPAQAAEHGEDEAAQAEGEAIERRPREGRRGRKFEKERSRPTAPLKAQRTTPVPSARAPLSDELEQELEAALGDMSLEQIVAAENAAANAPAPAAAEPAGKGKPREQGRIVSIHNEDVFVELGARRQGVLQLIQFPEPPQVGDVVEVVITRGENEDGLLQLSLPNKAMDVGGDWSALAVGTVVMAHVTGHNKGGLECQVSNIRGFIPASQASLYHVADLSTLVGEKFPCVITECNPERKNLVLSRRAVLKQEQEEAKQKAFASLEPGQVREGVVRKLMDFGAFVDLGGGVDGLLHVSRLSWGRVKHPSDVLKEGDTVRVQIEKIDPETERISLSMRDLVENPWDRAPDRYPVGSTVRGTVTRTTDFGAFVELEPGVEGLVHVSELASHRVSRVSLFVKQGQEVEAKVLGVDTQNKRISLSMKALQAVPEEPKAEEEPEEEATPVVPKKKRNQPLKGGIGRASGGENFGLKW